MHIIHNTLLAIFIMVLAASVWPGLIQRYEWVLMMLGVFVVAPVFTIALLTMAVKQRGHNHSAGCSELKPRRLVLVFATVVVLIALDLPARATIYLNKDSITRACNSNGEVTKVGVFDIHSSARTENGFYMVTLQHLEGLSADIVSHGVFCGKPGDSTPYGSARMGYRWVTSDIYYFFVSNDY